MRTFDLGASRAGPRSILCFGAHCDDIEIGCGAALLSLASHPDTTVQFLILTSNPERAAEATNAAAALLGPPEHHRLTIEGFRDGFLPYSGAAVKECFERIKLEINPDLIFTHHRHDLHQDHRLVSELTWNTFRNHLILEYEIPKWDGDLGQPNVYLEVDLGTIERKVEALLASFPSQAGKPWFRPEVFTALARLRGMECNATSGYAEAFYGRKLSISF